MRRVINVYSRFLGPFPWSELELFQAPDMFFGYTWIAPHGMVNLQETRVTSSSGVESAFRDGTPHMEAGVLAHELAHQYWAHTARAAHISEGWVNETFSETFACLYVDLAFGPAEDKQGVREEERAFEARMLKYKELWEELVPEGTYASLPRAYESRYQPQIVYNYGPYVMHKMLRRRVGDFAFFSTLDRFLNDNRQQYVAYEQLIAAFKDTAIALDSDPAHGPIPMAMELGMSSEDYLDAFFDYWVVDGMIPNVTATWSHDGGSLRGTLTSDVPFGTFDVPVRIMDGKKQVGETWVAVIDGEGSFEVVVADSKKLKVQIDPDGWILARSRTSGRG